MITFRERFMKNAFSLAACWLILLVYVNYRVDTLPRERPLVVTSWDAFGYYMYLPAGLIYHDFTRLNWLDTADARYHLTGGDGWQAIKLDDGRYTFKYLGGVAIMQLPLFLAGHLVAYLTGAPADGFSPPYQYAISFGALLYCFLALLLLRRFLLGYFSDVVTGCTLLLLALASNLMQYAAGDNGLSHVYLFVLYVLILRATSSWHRKPALFSAAAIGYIIGLATMSRPTEAIMLFIPLLWHTHTPQAARAKWKAVNDHRSHLMITLLFGFIGILPQLIYWKATTGSFIYDVGSKWVFLNPWFRVLLGWEKGWFIYTPVAVLFVAGLFFVKKFEFKNAVIWFCLFNIWIIIAWDEWRYGGSYSTRALVQSYPVFALPLAALSSRALASRWRIPFIAVGLYLIGVNIFQTYQYSKTILHYDDMNRKYYSRIYLNPDPSPLDISLLDVEDMPPKTTDGLHPTLLYRLDRQTPLSAPAGEKLPLWDTALGAKTGTTWIEVQARILAPGHLWHSFLAASLTQGDSSRSARVRLYSPISNNDSVNEYRFFMRLPFSAPRLEVYLTTDYGFRGEIRSLTITRWDKKPAP